MRKSAVVQCPEHVFCEQAITRNTAHPFCIRQYASFQDKYHLYFLFDLMSGGDLMDVLVAEAKVIKRRIPQGAWRRACLAPKVCASLVKSISTRHGPLMSTRHSAEQVSATRRATQIGIADRSCLWLKHKSGSIYCVIIAAFVVTMGLRVAIPRSWEEPGLQGAL